MVRNRVARGIPPIHRDPPIMKDLDKLAGLPPRSPTESLSVLEREAILAGNYWRLTQRRICETWNLSSSLVKRFKFAMYEAPLSIFRLPLGLATLWCVEPLWLP